ncbi:MAG: tRNA pseudouridine(13) synthase TruD [Planctomycetes bacterium]|nr:tRNA pseudouridine(13) synthase TruD [Planctomycetota bacterium]
MKIKDLPEDFVVRERYDLAGVGTHGSVAVYAVEKRNLTTFDAAIRIAGAAGVLTDQVRFAGIKDRRAVTTQVMSVEGGGPVSIDEEGLRVVQLGFAQEHVSSERLEGNEFELVLRDLTGEDLVRLDRGLAEIGEFGLPNYFDDQRFGTARSGRGFPVRELLRGNPEEALRLLVAVPSSIDSPEHARRKNELTAAWGDWARCLQYARGHHEQAVFRHLSERPDDFEGALRSVPRRERLMQLFAYQSKIWNDALDRLVRRWVPAGRRVEMDCDVAKLAAWRALEPPEMARWEAAALPLPDARTAPADADVATALAEALAADGLSMADLKVPRIRGMEFREEARSTVLLPDLMEAEDPMPDARHEGRQAVRLRLSLPRGAYATLVLKRALALPA